MENNTDTVQIPINNNQIVGFYNSNPITFSNLENCSQESFYFDKNNFYQNLRFNTYLNKNYLKENNKICPICLNSLNNINESKIIITNCNHIFCNSCINKHMENSNKCPLCNKEKFNYKKFMNDIKSTKTIEITTIIIDKNKWYNKEYEIKINTITAYQILYKYFIKKAWSIYKNMNVTKKIALLDYSKIVYRKV